MAEKSRKKIEYLQKEKSFSGEIRNIFHHFKGIQLAKTALDLRVRL